MALGKFEAESKDENTKSLQWHVYGLKGTDPVMESLEQYMTGKTLNIMPHDQLGSVDDLPWGNYQVFISPDVVDESFNFLALCALWLGIPTLVSSQSSIGKFLLSLSCPAKTRAVVNLKGNVSSDIEPWSKKIHTEILEEGAKPRQWASEISKYLQNNSQLWETDWSVFSKISKSRLSSRSLPVEQSDQTPKYKRTRARVHHSRSTISKVRHLSFLIIYHRYKMNKIVMDNNILNTDKSIF